MIFNHNEGGVLTGVGIGAPIGGQQTPYNGPSLHDLVHRFSINSEPTSPFTIRPEFKTDPGVEKKGHPHAEAMAEYAKDAAETDEPWKRWECQAYVNGDGWQSLDEHPLWTPNTAYRRKPESERLLVRVYQLTRPYTARYEAVVVNAGRLSPAEIRQKFRAVEQGQFFGGWVGPVQEISVPKT